MPSLIGWLRSMRRRPGGLSLPPFEPALVRLLDDPPVRDPDRPDHEQPQVADERLCEPVIADLGVRHVEPEAGPGQPATIRELELEVELDPLVGTRRLLTVACGPDQGEVAACLIRTATDDPMTSGTGAPWSP